MVHRAVLAADTSLAKIRRITSLVLSPMWKKRFFVKINASRHKAAHFTPGLRKMIPPFQMFVLCILVAKRKGLVAILA